MDIGERLNLAIAHLQSGRLRDAELLCDEVLAHEPNHPDGLHLLGVAALRGGDFARAVELISRAVSSDPQNAEFRSNLGLALMERRELPAAVKAFREAIALRVDVASFHFNLGLALQTSGDLNEAERAFRAALSLRPDHAGANQALGRVLLRLGRFEDAVGAFERAVGAQPESVERRYELGVALRVRGKIDAAIDTLQEVLRRSPDHVEAWNELGLSLHEKNLPEGAMGAYERAIALRPGFAKAHTNRGNVLFRLGRLDDALAAYEIAVRSDPGLVQARYNLGNACFARGEHDAAIENFRAAMELDPSDPVPHGNLLYCMHFHPRYGARDIYAEARRWNERHAAPLKSSIRPHEPSRATAGRKLRIGYVSPDLRLHAVGRFLRPLLREHDRGGFEIYCYADVANPDAMTEELRALSDVWRWTSGVGDEELAAQIRSDRIDILVDLTMHMNRNRLLVFARKPAPVQVTHLAYCSTTGLEAMDYRMTDAYLDPLDGGDIYSERSVRLARSYWCYDPPAQAPPVAPPPAIRNGFATFGCLNSFSKVNADVLKTWCALMRDVPGSRLVLHAHAGGHRERVRQHFAGEGVDPDRVRFQEGLALDAYLESYTNIDVALDPFPYGGGTTTCDAMWMGVPVVTLVGETAVSRGGLSLLSNVKLDELVARTAAAYVEIAAGLAKDAARLTTLRQTLRDRMRASPLMDARAYARDVEAAYRGMWAAYCGS